MAKKNKKWLVFEKPCLFWAYNDINGAFFPKKEPSEQRGKYSKTDHTQKIRICSRNWTFGQVQNIITTWLWLETHALQLFQARSNMVIFLSLVKSTASNSAMRTPQTALQGKPSEKLFMRLRRLVVPKLVPAHSFKSMIIQTLRKVNINKVQLIQIVLVVNIPVTLFHHTNGRPNPVKKTPCFSSSMSTSCPHSLLGRQFHTIGTQWFLLMHRYHQKLSKIMFLVKWAQRRLRLDP